MERSQPPPTRQTGPRFLSEDFLRPDQRRALGPRREKARRARGEGTKPLAAWAARRRGKRRAASGERAPKPLAARAARRRGKRRAAQGRGHPSLWLPGPLATEGKGAPHPGRGRPSLWLPELLRPGKAQNAGATESALLWSTRKLEPHSTQGTLHIEQPGA